MRERSRINPTIKIMKEIFEKVLTDRTARTPEEIEAIAAGQNSFEIWD